jgi:hypothetical protein
MATPITPETPVGYIVAEDVYISYREYYGDGTIYGRIDLLTPDGNPVKGSGKSKADLINANVTLSDIFFGSIGGDLVGVPNELPSLADDTPVSPSADNSSAVPEETPVCPPGENSSTLTEESPVSPPVEETPVSQSTDSVSPSTNESDNRYTVSFSLLGFDITREFSAKIDMESRKIYLS